MKILRESLAIFLLAFNRLFPKEEKGILSVYFHKPEKWLFRSVIESILKKGYTIITLKELEQIIRTKAEVKKKAVITFDDGSVETLDLIRSIREYNIPVAMFIPTEPVESGSFWWDFAELKGQKEVSGLNAPADFKTLPEDIFDQKIKQLKTKFKIQRTCITLDELKRLGDVDLITLGAHTVTHPILENCSFERQEKELKESKEQLGKWLRRPIEYFAYPNGDYNKNTLVLLKKLNYKMAFTTKPGRIDPGSVDPLQIPRYSINDEGGKYENLAKASGAWQRFLPS
ncbi:polysaccharide deacetylase family protein [Pollutibacter soli]|uniref:polysaccharide deacetylase family protein n=1 Tax=Pollutibacter soli TaxID=3034157 RepID=UPI0030132492